MTKLGQLSLHDVAIEDYSFLSRCRSLKTLDLSDTSFSDCRLLAELPALKKVFLPPYSQLKHTEVLEQLSCLQEIKEEKAEELKAAGQPCGEETPSEGGPASEEETPSEGSPASGEPLHLGDTAHLSIDGMGIVLFSPEVMKAVVPGSDFLTEEFTNPKQVGEHVRKGDITAFCTGTGGDFILWLRSGYPDSNGEKEFPVMIRLALEVRGGFLWTALAYEAVFAFPFHGEDLMYWLTEEELETVRSGLEKQPFGLHGWLGMDMSFYSNAFDNMAVIMECGDLEVLYGAASETGYKKLMKVMEGLGEAI